MTGDYVAIRGDMKLTKDGDLKLLAIVSHQQDDLGDIYFLGIA